MKTSTEQNSQYRAAAFNEIEAVNASSEQQLSLAPPPLQFQTAAAQPIQRQDKDKVPDAIGYMGLNPKAYKEEQALDKQSKDKVIGVTDDDSIEEKLDENDEIFSYLIDELDIWDVLTLLEAKKLLLKTPTAYRDQVVGMMRFFKDAALGKHTLKRLVISGHHLIEGKTYEDFYDTDGDGVGDEDYTPAENEMFGDEEEEMLPIQPILSGLAKLYPSAAAQVQHIMFSACRTSKHIEFAKTTFPNLKSIWIYKGGSSPSIKSGSINHVKKWERSTRGKNKPRKKGEGKVPKYGKAYVRVW